MKINTQVEEIRGKLKALLHWLGKQAQAESALYDYHHDPYYRGTECAYNVVQDKIERLLLSLPPEPRSSCSYDPMQDAGKPLGMFHCPECGEMVVAGMPHPVYAQREGEGEADG